MEQTNKLIVYRVSIEGTQSESKSKSPMLLLILSVSRKGIPQVN